jgi:hypothetical protein
LKFIKGGNIIEDVHENNFSAYLRAGFVEYKEDDKDELIEKLEQAGIDVDGRWSLKRLKEEVNNL